MTLIKIPVIIIITHLVQTSQIIHIKLTLVSNTNKIRNNRKIQIQILIHNLIITVIQTIQHQINKNLQIILHQMYLQEYIPILHIHHLILIKTKLIHK
jgi:hypothetical protein